MVGDILPRRKSRGRKQSKKNNKKNERTIKTEEDGYEKIRDLKDIGGRYVTQKEVEYTNLFDSWNDFTNKMNSQLMENMKGQQNE